MSYFYKIEEKVSRAHMIVHDGIYSTKDAAEVAREHISHNEYCRVVRYRTGTWNGPIRDPEEA